MHRLFLFLAISDRKKKKGKEKNPKTWFFFRNAPLRRKDSIGKRVKSVVYIEERNQLVRDERVKRYEKGRGREEGEEGRD